jgi:hypothetical protein
MIETGWFSLMSVRGLQAVVGIFWIFCFDRGRRRVEKGSKWPALMFFNGLVRFSDSGLYRGLQRDSYPPIVGYHIKKKGTLMGSLIVSERG